MTNPPVRIEQSVNLGSIHGYSLWYLPMTLTPEWREIVSQVPDILQKDHRGETTSTIFFQLPRDFIAPIEGERLKRKVRVWDLHNPEARKLFPDVWEGTSAFGDILVILYSGAQEPQKGAVMEELIGTFHYSLRSQFFGKPMPEIDQVREWTNRVAELGEESCILMKDCDGERLIAAFGSGYFDAEKAFLSLLGLGQGEE